MRICCGWPSSPPLTWFIILIYKFPTLYIEFLVKQIWVNQFNNKTTRFSRAASVLSIFLYVFFFFFLGLAWIHSLWLKVYLYRIHYIYVKALESFYNTNTGFMRFFSISYTGLQNVFMKNKINQTHFLSIWIMFLDNLDIFLY